MYKVYHNLRDQEVYEFSMTQYKKRFYELNFTELNLDSVKLS